MIVVDIVLVALLLGFIGAGWKDGFVHTFGRVIGAVIGFIIAKAWYIKGGILLGTVLPKAWAPILAFILIFILVTKLISLLAKLLDGLFTVLSFIPFLKLIDQFLGSLLGLCEGIVLLGGAMYVILTFALEPHLVTWLKASILAPWIQKIFQLVLQFLL